MPEQWDGFVEDIDEKAGLMWLRYNDEYEGCDLSLEGRIDVLITKEDLSYLERGVFFRFPDKPYLFPIELCKEVF